MKKKEGVLNFPWYVVNLEDWLHDFKIEPIISATNKLSKQFYCTEL